MTMMIQRLFGVRPAAAALRLALLAGLGACGGGGNESGPPDSLEITPAQVQVKGTGAACATGTGPTVFVHGGLPPYRLFNTYPQGMRLNKDTVTQSGEGFVVTFTGACFDTLPIRVEDALGHLGSVSLTNAPGQVAAP